MIIQSLTPVTAVHVSLGAENSLDSLQTASGRGEASDSVQISLDARKAQASQAAVISPALLLSDEQIQLKMGLVRTIMETLFGQKEDNAETPEEEMLQAVLAEAIAQEASMEITGKNIIA